MEVQFKRLTKGNRGRSSSRFDNMLITTRRQPAINGYGAAAKTHVFSPIGSSTAQISFFKRAYSTGIRTNLIVSKIIVTTRNTPKSEEDKDIVTLLKGYSHVKERAITKAKMKYVSDYSTENDGTMDPRLNRLKSPRNGEFIERLSTHTGGNYEKARLVYKNHIKNVKQLRTHVYRSSKKTNRYISKVGQLLTQIRRESITRRVPTFVKNQKLNTEKALPIVEQKRLGGKIYREASKHYERRATKTSENVFLKGAKNILHYRKASNRKQNTSFVTAPILPINAFQIKRLMRNRARKHGLNKQIAIRLGAAKTTQFYGKKRSRTRMSFIPVPNKRKSIVLSRALAYSVKQRKTFTKFTSKKIKLKVTKSSKQNIQKNFVKRFKQIRAVQKKVSDSNTKKLAKETVAS